jgi:D-alanine-D-alanine ligase
MRGRIGFTYDLRSSHLRRGVSEEDTAEFEAEETVDAIDGALTALGFAVERIGGVRDVVSRLAAGASWPLVFNFAEGSRGFGREAQVPALLDEYGIPYTGSDPAVLALALHKAMTKRVVRDLGLPTPEFAVVGDAAEADAVGLPFPLFVKPVAEGSSKGVRATSRVTTRETLRAACDETIRRFRQPALVETFLPGREMTVGILGTGSRAEVLGVLETAVTEEGGVYSYDVKCDWRGRVDLRLLGGPLGDEAARIALAAWRGIGCRDAGRVDLRCDAAGRPLLLEVNPIAGLRPGHSDLCILADLVGLPYRDLIARIVASAEDRIAALGNAR